MSLFNKNIVVLCLRKDASLFALKARKTKLELEVLSSLSLESKDDLTSLHEKMELSANDYLVICDDGSLSLSVNIIQDGV